MNNVTLIILLWLEFMLSTGSAKERIQSMFTAYSVFEQLVPSGIHLCRAHVCRDFRDWVTSKERETEVKCLGERFVSMFVHVANRVTSMESVREAMTLLAYLIVLCRKDTIPLRAFDKNSLVHEHHDVLGWSRSARIFKREFDNAASSLLSVILRK